MARRRRKSSKFKIDSQKILDDELFFDLNYSEEENDEEKFLRISSSTIEIEANRKTYPIDLWFLISEFILPEDIGRFSLICRSSNYVVNTVVFWTRLFRKHNRNEAKQIDFKENFSMIRTFVIKSLFEIYPPFQLRSSRTDFIEKNPNFLRLSRCVRIWYSKNSIDEHFNFYFEFRFDSQRKTSSILSFDQRQQTNEYFIEEDSCILHIISSIFVPIGPFMGMFLSQIIFNLNSSQLQMFFDSSRFYLKNSTKFTDSIVIFDSILCLKIYHWYNIPKNFD